MPAPSLCVVSGTVYDENGAPAPNVTLYLKRVLLNGVLIGTAPIGSVSFPSLSGGEQTVFYIEAITSNASGVVSFTVPQLSTIYIEGNVSGYNNGEVALSIPATATATLESLTPATFPIDVTTYTFLSLVDTPDDFTGDALKVARVNAAETAIEFATISVSVTAEEIQDALVNFFPDVAPFDWTYDDAGDRVTLLIADATAAAKGLMTAAYAARLDQLEVGDAPTFAGLITGATPVGINKPVPVSQLHTLSNAIGVIPFIAEGPAGQTANLQEWRVNGAAMASITTAGAMVLNNSLTIAATGPFRATGNFIMRFPAVGTVKLNNWNEDGAVVNLQFHSDCSVSRQAAGVLQFGDGSVNANGKVRAAEYQVAAIKVLGAQGAAVIDATDNPSAITQLNALLARLRVHGIIAT